MKIKVLPKEVVDKIAAGEVVQRPVSVIKELIENSLDANSTCIEVQIIGGGNLVLSNLIVTDDGDGIHPADLPLAAVRFATSKLTTFDDLKSIPTFGFRGEALASASMVSKLTIVSRRRRLLLRNISSTSTASNVNNNNTTPASSSSLSSSMKDYSDSCAYKQQYKDGKPLTTGPPTPIAGKFGTTVKVEDLFYNIPSRKRALEGTKKEMEEYHRILNVVQRYAVHKARDGITFICQRRKTGRGSTTTTSTTSSTSRVGTTANTTLLCDLNTKSLPTVQRVMKEITNSKSREQDDDATSSLLRKLREDACKEVIGHIFGSSLLPELVTLSCGEGDVDGVTSTILNRMLNHTTRNDDDNNNNNSTTTNAMSSSSSGFNFLSTEYYAYRVFGLITNGTYCVPKSSVAFLLFINDRLVECPSIKRCIETIYADTLPKGCKPFIYLSLHLPGPHIDVNVHPTKREVALLFEDRLCDDLARDIQNVILGSANKKTFHTQPLTLPVSSSVSAAVRKEDTSTAKKIIVTNTEQQQRLADAETFPEERKENSFNDRTNNGVTKRDGSTRDEQSPPLFISRDQSASFGDKPRTANNAVQDNDGAAVVRNSLSSYGIEENDDDSLQDEDDTTSRQSKKRPSSSAMATISSNNKRIYNPKNLVRTNLAARAGAIEPFLVQRTCSETPSPTTGLSLETERTLTFQHEDWCELSSKEVGTIDMSQPGAFATICRCQINKNGDFLHPSVRQRKLSSSRSSSGIIIQRPKRVPPTESNYTSIQELRKEVLSRSHSDLTTKLRDSTFVGCISRQWSLIQWEIELLMINHYELSKEMFYQLALTRFGGSTVATLAIPVNVEHLIYQALSIVEGNDDAMIEEKREDPDEGLSFQIENNDPNKQIAEQCTMCLRENMEMLKKYFNICFEEGSKDGDLYLVGLPVLLDGHSPPPHGLPTFLIRLATEVNWLEERPCFEAICTELGIFYAELPFDESNHDSLPQSVDDSNNKATTLIDKAAIEYVKHRLYPAFSTLLVPPVDFTTDGTVGRMALLSNLYKVFERC